MQNYSNAYSNNFLYLDGSVSVSLLFLIILRIPDMS